MPSEVSVEWAAQRGDDEATSGPHAEASLAAEPSRPQTRLQKRLRDSAAASTSSAGPMSNKLKTATSIQPQTAQSNIGSLNLSLFVQWYSSAGKVRVDQVQLRLVDSISDLQGISQTLVERAFPPGDRPDYLTSPEFCKFTPVQEFMSLPGDLARTRFRLVVTHDGWEYTVLEREMGTDRDPARSMLVTLIEFESTALMIGHLGVRMSLILYPLVSVKKEFLEDVRHRLQTDPDGFQGIL